jgi:hypothetical protein
MRGGAQAVLCCARCEEDSPFVGSELGSLNLSANTGSRRGGKGCGGGKEGAGQWDGA